MRAAARRADPPAALHWRGVDGRASLDVLRRWSDERPREQHGLRRRGPTSSPSSSTGYTGGGPTSGPVSNTDRFNSMSPSLATPPHTSTNVRRLTADDLPTMEAMNDMFGEAFAEPQTYTGDRPAPDYLEGLLADDRFIAVAALWEGTVVGGLVAYELRKFERERSEVYIYDLAVAAPHRRRGVATALIEHLRSIAAARGAWTIFVQADHGDDAAIALYAKLGRREDVLHFDIEVP